MVKISPMTIIRFSMGCVMKFCWYILLIASFVCSYNTNINLSTRINRIAIFQGKPLEVRVITKIYFERNHNVAFPQYSKFSSFLLVNQTSRSTRRDSTTNDFVVEPKKYQDNKEDTQMKDHRNQEDSHSFSNERKDQMENVEVDVSKGLQKKERAVDRTKIDILISKTKENDFKRGEIANLSSTRNKRKKYGFWHDISSIEIGVNEFWSHLGVESDVLPNEALLRLFDGHGLRYAIRRHGGRDVLHYMLGIPIMPGSWKEANQFKEIQYLIKHNKLDNLSFKTATWRSNEKQKVALVSGPRGGAKFVTTVKDRSTQINDQNDSVTENEEGKDGLENTMSNIIGGPKKKAL